MTGAGFPLHGRAPAIQERPSVRSAWISSWRGGAWFRRKGVRHGAVFAWEAGNAAGFRSVLGHRFDDQTTVVLLNNTSISKRAMDEFAYSLFGTV